MPTIKATNFDGQTFYVGLDVHKNSWSVTVRTLDFEVGHFTQAPSAEQLAGYLSNRFPGATFLSAYEAGFCGTGIHQQLCRAGLKNIIIHPADLPQTDKQKNNKTDLHDSRATARYLEAGVLRSIFIMPEDQQQRRALFRLRESKVRDVTRCNNRLRSLVYFFGMEIPEQSKDKKYLSKIRLEQIRTAASSLNIEGQTVVEQRIEELSYQRQQLSSITQKLKSSIRAAHDQSYDSLITIPGIGTVLTMALLAEIGDFSRFQDLDEYCSYLGLLPSQRSSGDKIYSVKMQPRCNRHLRPLMIEAAWQAIRKSPALLAYYKKHLAKGQKKAIIKVAAKLALIARAVAINHTNYKE